MLNLSKELIQTLCRKIGFYPRRSSGQNFLYNQDTIRKILDESDLSKDDIILEIGPGLGFLTEMIATRAKKLVAVELDRRLAGFLKDKLSAYKNTEVIRADIFEIDLKKHFKDNEYKLIANLPYNITSLVLRNFLALPPRPREMLLLVQKEVAERICARPGEMSLLSLVCQYYSSPRIIKNIGRENFWPEPKVDTCLIKLKNIGARSKMAGGERAFFKLIKVGFSAKRKKLTNNLKNGLGISAEISQKALKKQNLDPQIRPQQLSLENWLLLSKYFFDILI
ncbi:MAG: 16S rRNA (adenine(1518)-N(6)/adenine(1519)-N(6))-dimethyltransferase RsmA [Patescibacteria group bacterium]